MSSIRPTKCQFCAVKDRREKIKGIHPKGYIHSDCVDKYLKKKNFLEKERKEKDELVDTIVRIMGYSSRQSIPSSFYSGYLEPFRNNSDLIRKIKKYKEGFDYRTIKETFEYCEKDIKKYIAIKRENGDFKNTIQELRYAFGIVKNNIENYMRIKKRIELIRKRQESKIESMNKKDYLNKDLNVEIKKRKYDDLDISDFI